MEANFFYYLSFYFYPFIIFPWWKNVLTMVCNRWYMHRFSTLLALFSFLFLRKRYLNIFLSSCHSFLQVFSRGSWWPIQLKQTHSHNWVTNLPSNIISFLCHLYSLLLMLCGCWYYWTLLVLLDNFLPAACKRSCYLIFFSFSSRELVS